MSTLSHSPQEFVYTPAEVAGALRIDEASVQREIEEKRLSAVQIGHYYRITMDDLVKWLGHERVLEIFLPLSRLSDFLGLGGFSEDEAVALAEEAVRHIRHDVSEKSRQPAPSPEEVKRHLEK